MPLTAKGKKIKRNMEKEYGAKKGKQVFYASQNKGTIKGTHKMSSAQDAYVQGFVDKCAEAGIPVEAVLKRAEPILPSPAEQQQFLEKLTGGASGNPRGELTRQFHQMPSATGAGVGMAAGGVGGARLGAYAAGPAAAIAAGLGGWNEMRNADREKRKAHPIRKALMYGGGTLIGVPLLTTALGAVLGGGAGALGGHALGKLNPPPAPPPWQTARPLPYPLK